jgi:hypothetical protein
MSRRAICVTSLVFLLIVLGDEVFLVSWRPPGLEGAAVIGHVASGAMVAYALSAIAPMALWGFFRFRSKAAALPFLLWGFLLVVGLVFVGAGRTD